MIGNKSFRLLKIRPLNCVEISDIRYPLMRILVPGEWRSHLHRPEGLQLGELKLIERLGASVCIIKHHS